jgi:phenylalanyl-tRNA synthetase alpha chain
MQDTFYVDGRDSDGKLLLRTHTSPMQVRYARMHVRSTPAAPCRRSR